MKTALLAVAAVAAVSGDYSYSGITPQMRQDASAIINAALAPNATTVYDRLAYVCDTFGPRLSGSAALEAAIDHVVALATADGLNVTTETASVQVWVRGNEYATMISPRVKSLHMLGLGMSNGTGGAVITSPVLVVASAADLTQKCAQAAGKIVLFNVPFVSYGTTVYYRSQAAVLAAACNATAALVRSIAPYGIQTPHTGSSQTASIPAAAVSMEDATQMQRMQDRNQTIIVSLMMEAQILPNVLSRNIIMELRGQDKPDEFVVFGGHIDSWDVAEGAMDDGGGSFSSWEALRLIMQLGIRTSRTLRAVFWVNEENGAAGGSAYANDHANELNMTSIAIESDEGAFSPYSLAFSGHGAAMNQLIILSDLLAPLGAGNVTAGGGGTDIDPMCGQGVPCAGLEVLDPRIGSFSNNPCLGFANTVPGDANLPGSISNGYFWFHHTAADTIDRMDPIQLQTVAAAIAIWATSIANLPELLPRSGVVPPLPSPSSGTGLSPAAIGGICAGIGIVVLSIGVLVFRRMRGVMSYRSPGGKNTMGSAYDHLNA